MREAVWLGCRGLKKKSVFKAKYKKAEQKNVETKKGSERNLKADLNQKTRQQHKANAKNRHNRLQTKRAVLSGSENDVTQLGDMHQGDE